MKYYTFIMKENNDNRNEDDVMVDREQIFVVCVSMFGVILGDGACWIVDDGFKWV